MKMNDSRSLAQVEFGELDAETLDFGVGQVCLLSLDDSDFLFEVLDTSIDVIDIDIVHVGWLLVGWFYPAFTGS